MALSKKEAQVIRNTIENLRGKRAAGDAHTAITGPAKLYLESWVIPALEILLDEGKRNLDLAVDLSS
jgi:hypothetical protein